MSNFKHGKRYHKLYEVWENMKSRCYNKNSSSYKHYGGRGVVVCPEWKKDFFSFYSFSIKNGWNKDLQIDRIDTDGGYSPKNCRFVKRSQNSSTRRKRTDNSSGYIGVSWHKRSKHYVARVTVNSNKIRIGSFRTSLDAAIARDGYVRKNNLQHTLNF